MRALDQAFFERCPLRVAPDLLGCRLLHQTAGRERLLGSIVEVEAYLGDGSDPASHAHRGMTPRNASMFGAPGRFYVYRSMGLHACVNLVCLPKGVPGAVLLRAVEPLEGVERMQRNRGGRGGRELCNGPGKLSQAFEIRLDHDGVSALRGCLRVLPPADSACFEIRASPRIGISKAADLPYRFVIEGNAFVSRAPQNRLAERIRTRR